MGHSFLFCRYLSQLFNVLAIYILSAVVRLSSDDSFGGKQAIETWIRRDEFVF